MAVDVLSTGAPHFLGIGAPRSGTTWLYRRLSARADIWLPPIKELHYFDSLGDPQNPFGTDRPLARFRRFFPQRLRSLSRGDPLALAWSVRFFAGDGGLSWYASLFEKAARRGLLVGEITPAYMTVDARSIALAHSVNPAMRLIFIGRDPVWRVWSGLSKALARREIRLDARDPRAVVEYASRPDVAARSAYGTALDRWLRQFPREQLLILLFDELSRDAEALLSKVADHLQLRTPFHVSRDDRKQVFGYADRFDPPSSSVLKALQEHYRAEIERFASHYAPEAAQWLS